MSENESLRKTLITYAIQLFPSSIRDALLSDQDFNDEYGFPTDFQLSFGDSGVTIIRSVLFEAIRTAFKNPSIQPEVKDISNEIWKIEIVDAVTGKIALRNGKQRFLLSDLWPLLSQDALRLATFDKMADKANLPQDILISWRKKLSKEPVDDRAVDDVRLEIRDTPNSIIESIKSQIKHSFSFSTFVPNSARYYQRLVGLSEDCKNLTDYVSQSIKAHIEQLISWRPKDGLALALLLSVHTSIVSGIDLDKVGQTETVEVFKEISEIGDRVSQLGAIELGLSKIRDWPEIEPYLIKMLEQIRDDDPNKEFSRFRILSALIVLVDGQLSYSELFKDKPPFWRRLASIAHASLIERCIVGFPLDEKKFSDWAIQARGEQFCFQTFCDLRLEPKWMPDYVAANQLKAEFIGRIWNRAQQNNDAIKASSKLTELLTSEGPKGIKRLLEFPFSFFPGPLEGGIETNTDLPEEWQKTIKKNLDAAKLDPNSFNVLINSALVFKMEPIYADMAARALRDAKHCVKQGSSSSSLFSLLSGLALVAAVTRSTEMANELHLFTRRSMYQPGCRLTIDQNLQIALVSAASYAGLKDWCSFVGEWITELAFSDLNIEDAKRIYSHIKCLSRIEPELWSTLGRAEAALNAFISK